MSQSEWNYFQHKLTFYWGYSQLGLDLSWDIHNFGLKESLRKDNLDSLCPKRKFMCDTISSNFRKMLMEGVKCNKVVVCRV
jgi:hypothetical protein